MCIRDRVCTEVIQKNRRLLLKEKIQINLHDLDIEVYSDSKWLAFILQQILSNSVKYMGAGERKLEWYAKGYKEMVKLYLRDTGEGIGEKDLPRICEKGFTGDNGRTGKNSTGLGLYLSKKLCEKMGHKLEIVSKEGKGDVYKRQKLTHEAVSLLLQLPGEKEFLKNLFLFLCTRRK